MVPSGQPVRAHLPFRSVNTPGRPGYTPGLQRHHLLPRVLLGRRAFNRMIASLGPERIGFHDFRRNGLLLPATESGALRIGLPLHRGPHGTYSEMVTERFGQIEQGWSRTRRYDTELAGMEALMRLDLLQRALRRRLLSPPKGEEVVLNRRDPALDFSHLDRMAEMLWEATESRL
ncbi:MAG: AHH domain-containing protein [Novosphingobium sp.]|uniref:AHH domain-containing protein n=1 Tax=Novosphingobium sp. TaxID=1874826 RepID=UPI003015D069